MSKRQGDCYRLAGLRILDEHSWRLVHGIASGVQHAWLERDGRVWEPVHDTELDVAEFASKYRAMKERDYDAIEAAKNIVRTGHWGPWHD